MFGKAQAATDLKNKTPHNQTVMHYELLPTSIQNRVEQRKRPQTNTNKRTKEPIRDQEDFKDYVNHFRAGEDQISQVVLVRKRTGTKQDRLVGISSPSSINQDFIDNKIDFSFRGMAQQRIANSKNGIQNRT